MAGKVRDNDKTNVTSAWVSYLAARQDYLWFLGLMAWGTSGALWWRWGRAERSLRWLGWSALAGGAACAAELLMLITSVEPTPTRPAHLAGDVWLGLCAAVHLGGWWQTVLKSPGGRVVAWVAAVALAGVRWKYPDAANLLLAFGLTAAALVWARRLRDETGGVTAAFAASWAAGWLSSHGVLADWLDQRRRWMEVSHAGVFGGAVALLAGILSALAVARFVVRRWPDEVRAERLRDVRVFLGRAAVWLCVGFGFSVLAGHAAQAMFEGSMLTRVNAMAMAIDREALERGLAAGFRFESPFHRVQPSGRTTWFARSTVQAGPDFAGVRAALRELQRKNPDVRLLRIRLFVDGQVLLGPGARQDWAVTLEHPITDVDRADWDNRVADFRGMIYTSYDEVAQARAPLVTPEGKMLGWLVMDVGVSAWVAAQAQARMTAFAVVALGLGVLALWCVQRWREREREAALARESLAKAADQLKTSFLAKVSHELRTPLQSILGYGELAAAGARDPAIVRQLDALMQHGRLLTRLVNDLIDLNAMEAGALQFDPEAVRLPDALARPVESLQPRAAAKGLDFAVHTSGPAGVWINADPQRLSQIALNLAGNAIKFTARGSVTATISWATRPDGRIALDFTVLDTGPGIPPGDRAGLFKPFSRLATSSRLEGAGLGLAITAGLCGQMGGEVGVESDGRTGSAFRAKVVFDAVAPPAHAGGTATVQLPGRRILIADDNALVRELFLEHLLQLGARCAAVADGALAWERVQRETFDVMVLDLSMPGLDGLELARRICARPGPRPRLVAASAHARPEHRADALAAGFHEFLVKPVPLERLAHAVEADGRTATPPLAGVRERLRAQFRVEAPGQLAQLDELVRTRSWLRTRALAHHLRNSAFAVDDPALGSALSPLELAAEEENVAALDRVWPIARDALATWVASPSPLFGSATHGTAANSNPYDS